jgi:hypothetical protein
MFTPHGAVCTWGDTRLNVQSVRASYSAPSEIDITGMKAIVDSDPNDTNRKIVRRQVDYGVRDLGEVSLEFVANTSVSNFSNLIGTRRSFSFVSSSGSLDVAGYSLTSPFAYLTSFSIQAQVGDFIRGSATFKLSDQG